MLSSLITYRFKTNTFGIGSVATPQPLRKHGYASMLISDVVKRLEQEVPSVRIFLYSDINPGFYERFGFKRLPEIAQRYKATVCMVKGAKVEEFVGADQTPEYF